MESNRADAAVAAKPLGGGAPVVTGSTGSPDVCIAGAVVTSLLRPSPPKIMPFSLDSSS